MAVYLCKTLALAFRQSIYRISLTDSIVWISVGVEEQEARDSA